MEKFKVAVIQTRPVCGNVAYNLERALKLLDGAAKRNVKIACLPELFDTGYDLPWVKKNAAKTAGKTQKLLASAAARLGIYIIAGIANKKGGLLYNSTFLFSPSGRISGRYDKNYLFRAKPQQEQKYFREARGVKVANTAFGKVGFAICNDLRCPALFLKQAMDGAKIIFVSAAWGERRLTHWRTFLKARALENQIYIAAANQIGRVDKVRLAGHSSIVDFDGEVLAEKGYGEGFVIANIDYDKLKRKRVELPTFYFHRLKK